MNNCAIFCKLKELDSADAGEVGVEGHEEEHSCQADVGGHHGLIEEDAGGDGSLEGRSDDDGEVAGAVGEDQGVDDFVTHSDDFVIINLYIIFVLSY